MSLSLIVTSLTPTCSKATWRHRSNIADSSQFHSECWFQVFLKQLELCSSVIIALFLNWSSVLQFSISSWRWLISHSSLWRESISQVVIALLLLSSFSPLARGRPTPSIALTLPALSEVRNWDITLLTVLLCWRLKIEILHCYKFGFVRSWKLRYCVFKFRLCQRLKIEMTFVLTQLLLSFITL